MEIIVPPVNTDENGNIAPWPTLGPQVVDFIERKFTYGPGPLKGQPYIVRDEFRYLVYRMYEHYPEDFVIDYDGELVEKSGRRRFNRVILSLPKGSSKTEFMSIISLTELHPDAPVRFNGYDDEAEGGLAPGRAVLSPFIPLIAPNLEQVSELAYGVASEIVREIDDASLFDPTQARILINGEADSAIKPVSASAGRLDGGKPTFQGVDEPLALDTEVPTTEGFKTIETLQPGDFVFDRNGSPVRVLGKSDVHEGRPCYEVTFRNGEKVVTDENHRWKAVEWSNRPKGEQVVTTKQMKERGLTTGYGLRWRLPRGSGWEAGLPSGCPIDPYLLGIWLGDGSSDAGYIHTSETDFEALSAGFNFSESNNPKRPTLRRWLPVGLRTMLRHEKLLSNKHIPDRYLMESREWRLSLLAGLIDSDGYVLNGAVTFVQGKFALADKVRQLAVSLGFKASINSSDDPRSRTGKMWKVQFCPTEAVPTRIPRKEIPGRANHLSEWPQIASIEPVESVPVQCIEVDNDDHLFVFGRSGYLTHNTHRFIEDRHIQAFDTMLNNLPKRLADDPWQLSTTTAGDPSEASVALAEYRHGMKILEGKIQEPNTLFYHRQTSDENAKFDTMGQRLRALKEASGEDAAKFRDLVSVAAMWDDENNDHSYLERVWCNRWVQSSTSAFDAKKFRALGDPTLKIFDGSRVTLGMDGALNNDSTAIVATDVDTGIQNVIGLWERPDSAKTWTVPIGEVYEVVADAFRSFNVEAFYADPPYWQQALADWSQLYGDKVVEWPTRNELKNYYAIRAYAEAITLGEVGHDGQKEFEDHIANAGKNFSNRVDDEGNRRYVLAKRNRDKKIDICVAAYLSWQARLDVISGSDVDESEEYYTIPQKVR